MCLEYDMSFLGRLGVVENCVKATIRGDKLRECRSTQPVDIPTRSVRAATVGFVKQPDRPTVEVRRSKRRRRTVAAYRDGDTVVVMMPARLTKAEEAEWVEIMLGRLERQSRRQAPSDAELARKAEILSERFLDGLAVPTSVRWVDNQQSRWGSCTIADRTIRLSTRLRGMPTWVIDYVLLHELAHLLVPGHGPDFWEWVDRYPRTERARGYLEGVSATAVMPSHSPDLDDDDV
jgi:predicted metal-dependent hydrolase